MHQKIFINVPKAVSVLKISYILRILKKKYKFFGEKGDKNGFKVKKGYNFKAGYTYNAFWEGGRGVSALLEPLFFKKFPHNTLQKNTSCFSIMKQNLTSFFRPQSQSAAAEAVKILILKKKLFIQGVFKGPKNHTRAVKFLFIIKN